MMHDKKDTYDNRPRWEIKWKKCARGSRSKVFTLQCVLFRAEHNNAPLIKFQLLSDMRSDQVKDESAARDFWRSVYKQLAAYADLIDGKSQTALLAKIARRVPEPLAGPPRPAPLEAAPHGARRARWYGVSPE